MVMSAQLLLAVLVPMTCIRSVIMRMCMFMAMPMSMFMAMRVGVFRSILMRMFVFVIMFVRMIVIVAVLMIAFHCSSPLVVVTFKYRSSEC